MKWGVEMLDEPERIGFAVNNAGVDLISGLFDNQYGMEAYKRATNDYYETHAVPEGFKKEEIVLTDEAIDRAVSRALTEMFELGMFENPYRDAELAKETSLTKSDWDNAMDAHRKSVTLLKNDGTLPLTAEKLTGKKLYAEAFHKNAEMGAKLTEGLKELVEAQNGFGKAWTLTENPAAAVHANGGKVITNVNVTLAWLFGNVEPHTDALLVGYDTYPSATLDVIFGRFAPVGKLPLTFPRGDEVLAVDENGVCISPNDVPGYDKDQYMPESLKDENGKAYAYRDAAGNYYELNFGLTY